MPISAAEFLKTIEGRRRTLPGVQLCLACKIPLQETITGNRPTADGHVCSDCYFQLLGKEIDRLPIVMPRTARGA